MKSSLLSSALLACTVFSALTLPLAIMGSKSVQIEVQKENVFSGTVREAAVPYLGMAGLISLGAGVVSLSIAGWKSSHQKSNQIEEQLSAIQQELENKEIQIENLQISESYLKKSGLDQFLESLPDQEPLLASEPLKHSQVQPTVEIQPVVPVIPTSVAHDIAPKVREGDAASHPVAIHSRPQAVSDHFTNGVITQFSELQSQLKSMAKQIETLQTVFQEKPVSAPKPIPVPTPVPATASVSDSSTLLIEYLHHRLQKLESQWMREQAAS